MPDPLDGVRVIEGDLDAKGARFAILVSRFNSFITDRLLAGAVDTLRRLGADAGDITVVKVPGAWELPLAARFMALTQKVDAIVPMGVLIKGDTDHYDMIKDAATAGLMDLQLTTGVPVLCGILGCHTMEQAEERATGDFNHGVWWAKTAVEMATLRNTQLGKSGNKKQVGFGMFSEDDLKNLQKSPSDAARKVGF